MATTIICPNCSTAFEPTDAMREEVKKQLNAQVEEWKKKRDEEFRTKEQDLLQKLADKDAEASKMLETERSKITAAVSEQLKKQMAGDYELQIKLLQQTASDNEEKLKTARGKELEFLKREQEILTKEKELELELQKMLLKERGSLQETIRKEEAEKNAVRETEYQMKLKEMEMQLEAQRKLAEEMKRKAEQGSMQLQGEAQEVILEQLLKAQFPFDLISEVGKGVRGADCIQTVRNNFGQECGKIIYESKRTKDFGGDWIEKLKADMRSLGADIAVIVTQTMPKDMNGFGEKDGVWICNFGEVRAVAGVLRETILRVFLASKNQENKGDKMTMLYDYLTSSEFSEQWKAISEGYMNMRLSIIKERESMERLWKAREKQLDKILLNATHIRGSIAGISGMENIDLSIDGGEGLLLE